tara:strand:- start:7078 stop:7509 length:432 start_codon:yes stop_codon:yes gene_type:complete
MNWYECNNLEDLKDVGSFIEVKGVISKDLKGKIKITAKSWEDLFDKISLLRELFTNNDSKTNEQLWFDGFESETHKYLFCLTQIDGKNRQKNLGVSGLHYRNKDLAKKWRRKIAQKIHPDKCPDSRAKEAMEVLENMYLEMMK